jgi:hypothetical protein
MPQSICLARTALPYSSARFRQLSRATPPRTVPKTKETKTMRAPKSSSHTEYHIKQQVREILTDTGWKFWMPNAGAFGRGGVSDFLAVKRPSLFMAIETKYNDVITALQHNFLADVLEAEHYAFLVDETNVDVLREVLQACTGHLSWHPKYYLLNKWRNQVAEKLDV